MNVLVNYRVATAYHIVFRHFRTSVKNEVPRGVTVSKRRHIAPVDTEPEFEEIEHTLHSVDVDFKKSHQIAPSNKPDPRKKRSSPSKSIDSVDPIILKYHNFLADCSRAGKPSSQKLHSTNFGQIRFDHDNTPSIHGQFDHEEGPDMSEVIDDIFTRSGVQVGYQATESQTPHELEESSVKTNKQDLSNDEKAFEELFCKDIDLGLSGNDVHAVEKQCADLGLSQSSSPNVDPSITPNEGFIDSQFFGDLVNRNANMDQMNAHPSKEYLTNPRPMLDQTLDHVGDNNNLNFNDFHAVEKQSADVGLSQISNSNVEPSIPPNEGFIDSQFFGDLVKRNANINQMNAHPSKDLTNHRPRPMLDHTQEIGDTNNLNFIDQTYFRTPLDSLCENRKPAVEYSEIKREVENAFDKFSGIEPSNLNSKHENLGLSQEKLVEIDETSNIALDYIDMEENTKPLARYAEQQVEKKKPTPQEDPPPKSAFEYVLKKRRELHNEKFGFGKNGDSPSSKSYKKVMSLVTETQSGSLTKYEMSSLLLKSIIYNKNDIVGLYKPYGVAMHEGTKGPHHLLNLFLPELASFLKTEKLHIVHRLDAMTTGVLLLAQTETMANTLRKMLKNHEIKKTYWAITKGIPSPLHGTIDIPIAEGSINDKHRMVLRPDVPGFRGDDRKSHQAITDFKVISKNISSALVELNPKTGVKHQVRVHLGFGLSCPILGDHKYSHLRKMAPQKLPGDLLHFLKIKQSRVRDMPLYLHSRSVLIPEIDDGRNVFIKANLPAFFNKTLSILKLNTHNNQVRYKDSRCLDK